MVGPRVAIKKFCFKILPPQYCMIALKLGEVGTCNHSIMQSCLHVTEERSEGSSSSNLVQGPVITKQQKQFRT